MSAAFSISRARAKVAHHLQMFPDFGRGFRRKCAQGWLLASLGIAGMKREGIFMVGDHLVGERANSGESERSTASSLASISYRSPRPAAPPAQMPDRKSTRLNSSH